MERVLPSVVVVLVVLARSSAGADDSLSDLYRQRCGGCHVAYAPSAYGPEEWPGIVRSMRGKAALTVSHRRT